MNEGIEGFSPGLGALAMRLVNDVRDAGLKPLQSLGSWLQGGVREAKTKKIKSLALDLGDASFAGMQSQI